ECEPERECKQRGQARIGQYWNREYDMSAQEQPARRDRECQARRQANQPCRKEGTQNVKGRGSTTTRANRTREQQSSPSEVVSDHGRALLALGWIASPVRNTRSASAASTCVRARMPVERACARTF